MTQPKWVNLGANENIDKVCQNSGEMKRISRIQSILDTNFIQVVFDLITVGSEFSSLSKV